MRHEVYHKRLELIERSTPKFLKSFFFLQPLATNLCFGEKNVYTSEVLAVVMQQLMEQSPLPILLMRTVIQSLTMYPRLCGFVMNILARLIVKQVNVASRVCRRDRSLASACISFRGPRIASH